MQPPLQQHIPVLALICTTALSTCFMGLNKGRHQVSEYPILYAVFCLEVAAVYVLYMLISRIASLALNCIEQRSSSRSSPYDRVMEEHHLEWGELEDDGVMPKENPVVSILFARGIHREALISSMYLGGSGCFLALPALSFWNVSQTCAFLLALTAIAFFSEHTKLSEFAPNQDKATVLRQMRYVRWLLYAATTIFLLHMLAKDNQDSLHELLIVQNSTALIYTGAYDSNEGGPVMLILAFASPLLLRLALPQMTVLQRPSLMSPSQVLEAALPVSCLHAVLVLGWYSTPPLGLNVQTKFLPLFIPMLLICPFCQVIILAFILRGFRQKQTMGNVVVLALVTFIMQQIFGHTRMKTHSDWALLFMAILILIAGATLLVIKHTATASSNILSFSVTDSGGDGLEEKVVLLNDIPHVEEEGVKEIILHPNDAD